MEKVSLAVVFITKNEEYHIGAAIDNISDISDEIWVVDSGSSDRTVEIAKAKGATVVFHPFENFGAQWNFAIGLPIKTEWTMKMDPDERLNEALKSEIVREIAQGTASVCGYCFDRVLWFMGGRLNGVKNEVVRIWRTGACRFSEVSVNEHPIIAGEVKKLSGLMEHYDSKDLTHWLEKQNRYTYAEAKMRFDGDALAAKPRLFGGKLNRRMWLKRLFYHLPGRYLLLDVALFFMGGAWRSGLLGWRWVKCREMVMRLREYKFLEMSALTKKVPQRTLCL